MSSVRRYPTIQASNATITSTNPVINAGKALTQTVTKLSTVAQTLVHQMTQGHPPTVASIPSTAVSRRRVEQLQHQAQRSPLAQQLPPLELAKVQALTATAIYISSDVTPLQTTVNQVMAATTVEQVQQLGQGLTQTLEAQQQQLIVNHMVVASSQAALNIGFTPLHSAVKVMANRTVRVVANDQEGRTLVTEIALDPDREVAIAAEIIGTNDESCEDILDRFELALKEEGVHLGEPDRRFTGGICDLEAAQDFVKHQPVKPIHQRSTPKQNEGQRSFKTQTISPRH